MGPLPHPLPAPAFETSHSPSSHFAVDVNVVCAFPSAPFPRYKQNNPGDRQGDSVNNNNVPTTSSTPTLLFKALPLLPTLVAHNLLEPYFELCSQIKTSNERIATMDNVQKEKLLVSSRPFTCFILRSGLVRLCFHSIITHAGRPRLWCKPREPIRP